MVMLCYKMKYLYIEDTHKNSNILKSLTTRCIGAFNLLDEIYCETCMQVSVVGCSNWNSEFHVKFKED